MDTKQVLRSLVNERRGLLVPGAFNALSARVAADIGFKAIYVTGAGVTNMHFGMPDQAFMGLHEIAEHTARIRDAVEVPHFFVAQGRGNSMHEKVIALARFIEFEWVASIAFSRFSQSAQHSRAGCA